jgi:hypothetical protein
LGHYAFFFCEVGFLHLVPLRGWVLTPCMDLFETLARPCSSVRAGLDSELPGCFCSGFRLLLVNKILVALYFVEIHIHVNRRCHVLREVAAFSFVRATIEYRWVQQEFNFPASHSRFLLVGCRDFQCLACYKYPPRSNLVQRGMCGMAD